MLPMPKPLPFLILTSACSKYSLPWSYHICLVISNNYKPSQISTASLQLSNHHLFPFQLIDILIQESLNDACSYNQFYNVSMVPYFFCVLSSLLNQFKFSWSILVTPLDHPQLPCFSFISVSSRW